MQFAEAHAQTQLAVRIILLITKWGGNLGNYNTGSIRPGPRQGSRSRWGWRWWGWWGWCWAAARTKDLVFQKRYTHLTDLYIHQ